MTAFSSRLISRKLRSGVNWRIQDLYAWFLSSFPMGSSSLCQACPRFHQIWLFIRKMRVRMGQVIEVKKTKPVKNNPVLILRKKKSNNFKRKRK